MAAVLLPSCTKNDETTIVPIGTEDYIDGIHAVISAPDFWADFGDVNEGFIPPDIRGKYLVAPKLRVKTNVPSLPSQFVEPNMDLCFTWQNNELAVIDMNESTETVTDTVFVKGNGNAFTAYFIEDKSYEVPLSDKVYHVSMQRGIVMKGTVDDAGIHGFRMGTIILAYEDDSQGALGDYTVGSYFIYEDSDGLATRMEE